MPLLSGIAAVLLLLFILVGVAAFVVAMLVLPAIENLLDRARLRRAASIWADDAEEPLADGSSDTAPAEVRVWWSTGDLPAETVLLGGSRRAGATAVAERPATEQQIWTIHPDHSAHWQDEAGDCKWCRDDPA